MVQCRRVLPSSAHRGRETARDINLAPDYCGTEPGDRVTVASHKTAAIRVGVVRPNNHIMGARLFAAIFVVFIIADNKIAEAIWHRVVLCGIPGPVLYMQITPINVQAIPGLIEAVHRVLFGLHLGL